MLLPAAPGAAGAGLDIYNAAAPPYSLRIALIMYLIGLAIVTVYLVHVLPCLAGPRQRRLPLTGVLLSLAR